MGLLITPALAQDEQVMETVVVSGIKASLQSALSIKQNADQVVDSITAVDIGALPDRTVAEALQRVPGVQLTRTDSPRDPARWGGTGNGVFVRGLSWVKSLTNGRDIFSATNGRTLSFADVSASLMAGVDVYKNPSAKMIEGGLGGTVDLRTRKPFDQSGQLIAISGDMTYGDIVKMATPSVNALYSNRWDTQLGEIGVLLSADYQDQRNTSNLMNVFTYGPQTTSGGDTVYIPLLGGDDGGLSYRRSDWRQQRVALDTTLQWRPSEALEITLTGIYSKAEPKHTDYVVQNNIPQSQADIDAYTYNASAAWIGGTMNNVENYNDSTRLGQRHNINGDYSLNIKYTPNSNWTFNTDVQFTESRTYDYNMSAFTKLKHNSWINHDPSWDPLLERAVFPNAPVINITADLSGSTPVINYDEASAEAVLQRNNYFWYAAMDHLENNYANAWSAREDVTYTFGNDGFLGWLKSADFGFRAELKQSVTRQTGWNWQPTSFAPWWIWGNKSATDLDASVYDLSEGSAALQDASMLYSFGKFFGRSVPSAWLPSVDLLANGGVHAYSIMQEVTAGWASMGAWVPLAVQANCGDVVDYKCAAVYEGVVPGSSNMTGGINSQKENTYAGYVQLNYAHDTFFGFDVPVDGNIGVRIVSTEVTTGPGVLMLPAVSACSTSGGTVDCHDQDEAYAFVGNSGNALTDAVPGIKSSFTNVLPSFNFRALLSDHLFFRMAYSQAIVRPDFSYTMNSTSLRYNFAPSGGTFSELLGTGGNPDLKPLKAHQYDASLEWYFSPTSSVALAVFHKNIADYFMAASLPETYTRNGITETFNITRFYNGNKGKVEGFEFAYQQFFDELPGAWGGLGMQFNYTKIYNSGGANTAANIYRDDTLSGAAKPLPMEGMSNDSFNLALMYEKYDISGRLAYNWRSRYLMSSSAANLNAPVWARNFGQLDGSVFYTFQEHYKIGLQATNLLKSTAVLEVGEEDYHPRYEWVDTDRKLSVVLRATW